MRTVEAANDNGFKAATAERGARFRHSLVLALSVAGVLVAAFVLFANSRPKSESTMQNPPSEHPTHVAEDDPLDNLHEEWPFKEGTR